MENIFTKLDFDNPLLDGIIVFILVTIYQYIETIYDEKKTVSFRLSLMVFFIVFLIVYYLNNKFLKSNITTQEIFTDMMH
jgi:hypothetical protein